MIWVLGCRLWYGADDKWSDFRFIAMGFIAFEVEITLLELFRYSLW